MEFFFNTRTKILPLMNMDELTFFGLISINHALGRWRMMMIRCLPWRSKLIQNIIEGFPDFKETRVLFM